MITADLLEAKGACSDQVRLFRELFPHGAPLTVAAAVAVADRFDWQWAANNLLSATAWEAYNKATAPASKAYREATAPAWEAYNKARATASKAYREATATASKAYDEARATAFAQAYIADQVQK
jgi:hypothetical protein